MTIYVSIGNSDDTLSQREWRDFIDAVDRAVGTHARQIHGRWFSEPISVFQNACWTFETTPWMEDSLKQRLREIATTFRQDAIAWAVAETEWLGAAATVGTTHAWSTA